MEAPLHPVSTAQLIQSLETPPMEKTPLPFRVTTPRLLSSRSSPALSRLAAQLTPSCLASLACVSSQIFPKEAQPTSTTSSPANEKIEVMLQLSSAGKRFGQKLLFEDANWLITPDERTGLVGGNGTGKSTLLKILGGIETLDYGQLTRVKGMTLGYLPQDGLAL